MELESESLILQILTRFARQDFPQQMWYNYTKWPQDFADIFFFRLKPSADDFIVSYRCENFVWTSHTSKPRIFDLKKGKNNN